MGNSIVKKVSNDIEIEVLTKYQRAYSNPIDKKFIFAYQITITNQSSHQVQLLSRKWFIFDSSGKQTLVTGDGVVGKQPVLQPGESFQYVSSCPLESPLGYMKGEYTFLQVDENQNFCSSIPQFQLTCPDILN